MVGGYDGIYCVIVHLKPKEDKKKTYILSFVLFTLSCLYINVLCCFNFVRI